MISVNMGRGRPAEWAGRIGRTAIDKRPCPGPVTIGRLGAGDDEQADRKHHGGPYQALYAYAREDLDWWTEQLGRELANGVFGENITTAGLDVCRRAARRDVAARYRGGADRLGAYPVRHVRRVDG